MVRFSFFAVLVACGNSPPAENDASIPNDAAVESSSDAASPVDAATTEAGDADAASKDPTPSGPSGTWKLAWHDEFDGTALDPANWNSGWLTAPSSKGKGNITAVTDSQQSGTYFGPAALSFPGDGALHVRLSAPVDPNAPTGFTTRESGLVTTAGLWNVNPGSVSYAGAGQSIDGTQVIEIRARLAGPASDGAAYWPAFWMTNAGNYNGGGESYSEEVDLLEGLGNGSTGSNLKFHLHSASEYSGGSVVPAGAQSDDFSLTYHAYTFELSTTAIQCWSDGMLVGNVAPSSALVGPQWAVPQYMMFAFQATTGATLPTSGTGAPNDLMIDYVRIWTQ
ncbi:MAG TPA: family 16 glycosylhydrolase [Polyangiaceae bacterium]|nr:family 16 glycosylhydrolase [Polyangiaceae bacterium]